MLVQQTLVASANHHHHHHHHQPSLFRYVTVAEMQAGRQAPHLFPTPPSNTTPAWQRVVTWGRVTTVDGKMWAALLLFHHARWGEGRSVKCSLLPQQRCPLQGASDLCALSCTKCARMFRLGVGHPQYNLSGKFIVYIEIEHGIRVYDEDSSLVGCNRASLGERFPTFRKQCVGNVGDYSNTAS